ncbi:hypothetical protein NQK81_32120 [Amycolatopsis roodepoortensis]|nr:hypothetical protein [Amycolatopsis roodepoortensis]UUV29387.1 hypothetical protein NQK81_32120 [Amycolatopsis roodepoortensis]
MPTAGARTDDTRDWMDGTCVQADDSRLAEVRRESSVWTHVSSV